MRQSKTMMAEIEKAVRDATRPWKLDAIEKTVAWEKNPDDRRRLMKIRVGIDVAKRLPPSCPTAHLWKLLDAIPRLKTTDQ